MGDKRSLRERLADTGPARAIRSVANSLKLSEEEKRQVGIDLTYHSHDSTRPTRTRDVTREPN